MGMTMVEKILTNHSTPHRDVVKPGEFITVNVDTVSLYGRPIPAYRYTKICARALTLGSTVEDSATRCVGVRAAVDPPQYVPTDLCSQLMTYPLPTMFNPH